VPSSPEGSEQGRQPDKLPISPLRRNSTRTVKPTGYQSTRGGSRLGHVRRALIARYGLPVDDSKNQVNVVDKRAQGFE
jgi:hypothetical protein